MKRTVSFSKNAINVFFHLLTACNLRCRHCYINPSQHGDGVVELPRIKKWLAAFSDRDKSANVIFLGGEPTLHPHLSHAVKYARKHHVKVYAACNIFPKNNEQNAIVDYLHSLGEIGVDAVIIADPGIFMTASKVIPQIPIHLSTQANTTHLNSALFWQRLGIKRVNLARELSLKEIKEVARHCDLEIEAFVHGSMCIAYSGRCLLSSFMANRDSNRGMCTQSCRWKYAVVEEFRPGQYMPIAEDDRGSYIFSSKDLCMIEHIPEIIESGII